MSRPSLRCVSLCELRKGKSVLSPRHGGIGKESHAARPGFRDRTLVSNVLCDRASHSDSASLFSHEPVGEWLEWMRADRPRERARRPGSLRQLGPQTSLGGREQRALSCSPGHPRLFSRSARLVWGRPGFRLSRPVSFPVFCSVELSRCVFNAPLPSRSRTVTKAKQLGPTTGDVRSW